MEMIQKIFPFSFNFKAKDVNGLVVSILVYIVGMILSGVAMFVLGLIPIVGILTGIIGWIIEVYLFVGIVLSVLNFCNVLKKD
jgi:hypothetical protein